MIWMRCKRAYSSVASRMCRHANDVITTPHNRYHPTNSGMPTCNPYRKRITKTPQNAGEMQRHARKQWKTRNEIDASTGQKHEKTTRLRDALEGRLPKTNMLAHWYLHVTWTSAYEPCIIDLKMIAWWIFFSKKNLPASFCCLLFTMNWSKKTSENIAEG